MLTVLGRSTKNEGTGIEPKPRTALEVVQRGEGCWLIFALLLHMMLFVLLLLLALLLNGLASPYPDGLTFLGG